LAICSHAQFSQHGESFLASWPPREDQVGLDTIKNANEELAIEGTTAERAKELKAAIGEAGKSLLAKPQLAALDNYEGAHGF
jgi:hypothetical protein